MPEKINDNLEKQTATESLEAELSRLMRSDMEAGARTDVFEVAEAAREKAAALLEWRQAKRVSDFGAVYGMVEETAAAVEKIFATKYSRGDMARDLNDLPMIVAQHILMEAIKLFPEKAKMNAKKVLDAYSKKFKR